MLGLEKSFVVLEIVAIVIAIAPGWRKMDVHKVSYLWPTKISSLRSQPHRSRKGVIPAASSFSLFDFCLFLREILL